MHVTQHREKANDVEAINIFNIVEDISMSNLHVETTLRYTAAGSAKSVIIQFDSDNGVGTVLCGEKRDATFVAAQIKPTPASQLSGQI